MKLTIPTYLDCLLCNTSLTVKHNITGRTSSPKTESLILKLLEWFPSGLHNKYGLNKPDFRFSEMPSHTSDVENADQRHKYFNTICE